MLLFLFFHLRDILVFSFAGGPGDLTLLVFQSLQINPIKHLSPYSWCRSHNLAELRGFGWISSKAGDIKCVTGTGRDSTIKVVFGSDEGPGVEGSDRNVVGCMSKEFEEFRPLAGSSVRVCHLDESRWQVCIQVGDHYPKVPPSSRLLDVKCTGLSWRYGRMTGLRISGLHTT